MACHHYVIISLLLAVFAVAGAVIDDVGPPINGEWSFWEGWGACSKSCENGVQSRQRACADPAPSDGGIYCEGSGEEIRECSQWDCPDCSMTCPRGGSLDYTCSICECERQIPVTGRVSNDEIYVNPPLSGVAIYAVTRPWKRLAVTDSSGYFSLPETLCREDLKLRFVREGYHSDKEEYDVPASEELVVNMKKQHLPRVRSHPVSGAAARNQQVSFSCSTSRYDDPPAHTFRWYHDDELLEEKEAVVEPATITSTLTITNVHISDAGQYYCQAVSRFGSSKSRLANLLYLDSAGTPVSTCELKQEKNTVFLHSSCTVEVDGEAYSHFHAGGCVCDARDGGPDFGCCRPSETEMVSVSCEDFSYQLARVISCGWSPCEREGRVWIEGIQRIKKNNQSTIKRFAEYFVPNRPNAREHLGYNMRYRSGYYSHLTTLPLQTGVNHYRLAIDLKAKSEPLNVGFDEVTQYRLPTYANNQSIGKITVPGRRFQTLRGDEINDAVDMHMDMIDVHGASGLESAPGEMIMQQGRQSWLLRTYGLLWFNVRHVHQDAVLASDVALRLRVCALRLTNSRMCKWPGNLMTMDSTTGSWVPLSYLDGTKRGYAEGSLLFPSSLPAINIAEPYKRESLCEVAVYVYRTHDISQSLSGEMVIVHTKSRSGTKLLSYYQQFTNEDGKACLLVPCGQQHVISVHSMFQARPSEEHHLPDNFTFLNSDTTVTLYSPLKRDMKMGETFHRYIYHTCQQSTIDDFHFKFHLIDAPIENHLSVVEPLPNHQLSWYRNEGKSSHRKACYIRIGIKTLSRSAVQVVGINKRTRYAGRLYGTSLAGVESVYDAEAHAGDGFSCLQVRCPDVWFAEGDPPETQTHLSVHVLNSANTTCKMSWVSPYLRAPEDSSEEVEGRLPPVHILDTSDKSMSVRLNSVSYSDDFDQEYYIPGFYSQVDSYERSLFGTHARCLNDQKALLALFDCADGQVSSGWWDDPKVPGEIYELPSRPVQL